MSAARDQQEVLRADCASTEQGRALVRITCLRPVWTSKPAMAEWAFMLYLQEENFPIFLASIGDSSGDYPGNNGYWGGLDDWDIGDGRRDEGFVIGFPRDFVEAPEVGWELMLFFIGHELGHALGDEAPCHDEVGIVCEGQCDHWAASVALRRVVGDGLFCKSYSTIAQSAADQLEEYMTRIHSDPSCGGPYCDVMCADNSPACGHPPMECRTATIEAAIDLLAEPTCTRSWYTDPDRSISCPAPTFPGGDPCPP